MFMSIIRDKSYWEKEKQESLEYFRYWGCRNIPAKIIPGMAAQDFIAIQEKCAGVPFHHPEFTQRMRKYEENLRRERQERLVKLAV